MATAIYRCPTTGMKVQGWFADDPSADNHNKVYQAVACPACTRLHLVNPTTGRTLGDNED